MFKIIKINYISTYKQPLYGDIRKVYLYCSNMFPEFAAIERNYTGERALIFWWVGSTLINYKNKVGEYFNKYD